MSAARSDEVVELRVWGVPSVAAALAGMATDRTRARRTPGVRFAKLMGTGTGDTFTPCDADAHHWALLTVHDDTAAADAFAGSRVVRGWDERSDEHLVVRMSTITSRGAWSRREPFAPAAPPSYDGPVAALTRARLRPTRALSFWRAVPPVVGDLRAAPGVRLALGVGEAPVGLQGTFSLWDSSRRLVDFAYRSAAHREAVEQTERQRWYAEELFARFAVLDVRGTHRGRTP